MTSRVHVRFLICIVFLLAAIWLAKTWLSPSGRLLRAIMRNDVVNARSILNAAPQIVHYKFAAGMEPIHYASLNKSSNSIVSLLLDHGANINAKDSMGKTPLIYAVVSDNFNVSKLLLRRRANVNDIDSDGVAAIHIAAWKGNNAILGELIKAGADVNTVDRTRRKFTPLHYASRYDRLAACRLLLSLGAKVDQNSALGPPLAVAIRNDKNKVVAYLIQKHANIEEEDPDGKSLMHIAAETGNVRAASLLLKAGANINVRNSRGITPLHSAVRDRQYDMVSFLLKHGANKKSKDKSGAFPRDYAVIANDQKMIDLLDADTSCVE